ncbi:hypothetical protein GIB67_040194 [Kingdonia uniflora]|uniref:Uncharacterized protein n=1 Tax=Kingdonia uniflora TaxID=39325 RepID=A0A7J7MV67_9MAGN|nr:hypothetical protein GIB67_040194 [Kingdonia uniflora]
MDKYVERRSYFPDQPKPLKRHPWTRCTAELTGRFSTKYRRQASALLLKSYSEVGAFPHLYHIGNRPCPTQLIATSGLWGGPLVREEISGLEFDLKGTYLASVTKAGCLTVHDFESLSCVNNSLSTCLKEDETKHLLHFNMLEQLDVVRWNLTNQDEVACTSKLCKGVFIFDIGYTSSDPITVLTLKPTLTVHGYEAGRGLSDIAFTSNDKSRCLACDIYGVVHVWDRRISHLPVMDLTSNFRSILNSIQINVENQIVFGAGKDGIVHVWDLRGGTTSVAFQSQKELRHPPLASLKLAPMIEKIGSLKEQSEIFSREIHSINFDPCCHYQLAFHLDDGWSGVLDINSSQVTHIHCPPPAWLNAEDFSTKYIRPFLKKPAWLPTSSRRVGAASATLKSVIGGDMDLIEFSIFGKNVLYAKTTCYKRNLDSEFLGAQLLLEENSENPRLMDHHLLRCPLSRGACEHVLNFFSYEWMFHPDFLSTLKTYLGKAFGKKIGRIRKELNSRYFEEGEGEGSFEAVL